MSLPSHRVAARVENLHVACRILDMCRMVHFRFEIHVFMCGRCRMLLPVPTLCFCNYGVVVQI